MPSRKRNIEIEVLVDDKRAKGKLTGLGTTADQTGGKFTKMGKAVVAGLAFFGGREMLQAVQRLDELNTRMQANEERANVVFANMADSVRKWADEQNEAFGIGENALLGLASNMQDLLVPMGFAREAALDLTQETLILANALDDWKGGTLGVENATERIIKAMLGEREGLVELGIKISEADVKTRLLEKGQEDLTGASLAQAKATATLELITEKSADAMAKYADRAGTAVATNKELTATTDDVSESLAEALAPALQAAKLDLLDVIHTLQGVRNEGDGLGDMLGNEFMDWVEAIKETVRWLTQLDDAFDRFRNQPTPSRGQGLPRGFKLPPSGGGSSGGGGNVFHEGGVVEGTPGEEQLAALMPGETVLPTHKPGFATGPSTLVNIYATQLTPTQMRELQELARRNNG